jgi:hypothetical protein
MLFFPQMNVMVFGSPLFMPAIGVQEGIVED